MKKTLVALMALACPVALADLTPEEAKDILTTATTVEDSFTFSAGQQAFTVVAVVDLEKYAALRPTLSTSNRPHIMTFTDSGNYNMGALFGDTGTMQNCLFTTFWAEGGADRGGWQNLTGIGQNVATTPEKYIGNAQGMTITLAYSAPNGDIQGTTVTFSYINNDGDVVSVTKNDTGLRFSNNTLKTLTVNTDIFSDVYMIEGTKYMGNDVVTLTKAALAPEPATATLSLLALAGLAARRRRH